MLYLTAWSNHSKSLVELMRMLMTLVKIYKKLHWPFKEATVCPKSSWSPQPRLTWCSMLAMVQSLEHPFVLASLPWHLLFCLLGRHLSWSFKWGPLTHFLGFNSNVTSSRKTCVTEVKQVPFLNFSLPHGSILSFSSVLVSESDLMYVFA